MWSAWGFHVPSTTSIVTRLFAKSASFYNPLIYFGMSSKFRKDIAVLLPCIRRRREVVRLQHFKNIKPKAEAPSPSAPLPVEKLGAKYAEGELSQSNPDSDSGVNSPPETPPSDMEEVFHIDVPSHIETSEYWCDRLWRLCFHVVRTSTPITGEIESFFVFFGLTHVNKLYVCLQINYFLNLRVSQLFERVFISSPNISCGEIQDSSQNVSSWWNVQSKPKRDKGCTKTSGTTDASTAEACDGTAFCHFPCCPWGHSCQIRYTLLYPTFFRGCQIMCCLYPSTEASAWSKSFLLRKNIYFPTPVNKLEQLYFWQVSTLILVLTENKQPCKRSFSNILNEKWCTSTIKV